MALGQTLADALGLKALGVRRPFPTNPDDSWSPGAMEALGLADPTSDGSSIQTPEDDKLAKLAALRNKMAAQPGGLLRQAESPEITTTVGGNFGRDIPLPDDRIAMAQEYNRRHRRPGGNMQPRQGTLGMVPAAEPADPRSLEERAAEAAANVQRKSLGNTVATGGALEGTDNIGVDPIHAAGLVRDLKRAEEAGDAGLGPIGREDPEFAVGEKRLQYEADVKARQAEARQAQLDMLAARQKNPQWQARQMRMHGEVPTLLAELAGGQAGGGGAGGGNPLGMFVAGQALGVPAQQIAQMADIQGRKDLGQQGLQLKREGMADAGLRQDKAIRAQVASEDKRLGAAGKQFDSELAFKREAQRFNEAQASATSQRELKRIELTHQDNMKKIEAQIAAIGQQGRQSEVHESAAERRHQEVMGKKPDLKDPLVAAAAGITPDALVQASKQSGKYDDPLVQADMLRHFESKKWHGYVPFYKPKGDFVNYMVRQGYPKEVASKWYDENATDTQIMPAP